LNAWQPVAEQAPARKAGRILGLSASHIGRPGAPERAACTKTAALAGVKQFCNAQIWHNQKFPIQNFA
jgi:hypothetical protein